MDEGLGGEDVIIADIKNKSIGPFNKTMLILVGDTSGVNGSQLIIYAKKAMINLSYVHFTGWDRCAFECDGRVCGCLSRFNGVW